MLNLEEVNALGNILNTTFGKASTNQTAGTLSISGTMQGENLILSLMTLISFGGPFEREAEMKRVNGESEGILDAALKRIKEEFKSKVGRTLKLKNLDDQESYQLTSLFGSSGRRDAFYIRKLILEME